MDDLPPLPEPPPDLDENHFSTLQEVLSAISAIPGVAPQVEAFMRGRGIDDPQPTGAP